MKKRLALVAFVVAFFLMGLAGTGTHAVTAIADDELFPCDPAPSQIRICQIRGGTFNYVTCRCDFPE
jgi:hypothetical protein